MKFVVMWISAFPVKSGLSTTYSPQTIMTGTILDWTKHYKVEFGAYCEFHEEHSPMTNNRIYYARNCRIIFFEPTSNFQVSYTFLRLKTDNCINHNKFSVFPMPDSVVKRVEELATIDTQLDEDLTF